MFIVGAPNPSVGHRLESEHTDVTTPKRMIDRASGHIILCLSVSPSICLTIARPSDWLAGYRWGLTASGDV